MLNFCFHCKTAKGKKADSFENAEFVEYDFATIKSATTNFSPSNVLGQGGFGVVYRGTLKSGKEIAIKRLRGEIDLSTEVFVNESRVVAKIQHANLVKHLGFCSQGKERFLVYKFLPNASLARLLCDTNKMTLITWETWYKIILGMAKGLEYLHGGTHGKVLHYGLKTSNVLLDEEMNPKIADFGMNMLFDSTLKYRNTFSAVATESDVATFVYVAPEYCISGKYSVKSDVYSFGVIVLEIVSALKNGKSNQSWLTYEHHIQARKLWDEDRLSELINPSSSMMWPETDVIRFIKVGILCVQENADHRPTMTEAIMMLTDKVAISLPSTP